MFVIVGHILVVFQGSNSWQHLIKKLEKKIYSLYLVITSVSGEVENQSVNC